MEGTQSVDGGASGNVTGGQWTVNGQTDNVVTALLMEGWDQ